MDLAVDALLTRDKEKADAVIRGDHEVDQLEIEVEHLAIALLALQQPMGRDLRFIISAIKISSDLERVGDHAVNIAQSALRIIAQRAPIMIDPAIEDMARRARRMLSDALDAFVRADGALGREVCQARRRRWTRLHDSLFRILLTHMMADPKHDHAVARAAAGEPQPGARRRPGHEHRRGRGFSGGRQADQASFGNASSGRESDRRTGSRDARRASAFSTWPRRSRGRRKDVRIAAIDIGSNSIRQIVADVSPDGQHPDHRRNEGGAAARRRPVARRRLSASSMRHALEAVQRMTTLARQLGAARIHVGGDERRARSGEPARLPRPRSARRRASRCACSPARTRRASRSGPRSPISTSASVARWSMDIGGGSLELAMSADGLVERLESFPFGALRLTEEFLGDRPKPKQLKRLRDTVRDGIRQRASGA